MTQIESSPESLTFAQTTCTGFKVKADHNKNESLWSLILILTSSLCAPLFITLAEGIFWSKAVPSILSVFAAGLTSWLQLRKPQKLWSMYRGAQRQIEDQITKFKFKIGDYKESEDPGMLLAERVAEVALNAHNEWTSFVPSPESFVTKANQSHE
jgi:hypothetical protein